jgi:mannose-6-phosphate isomerase-like protein (cupin superfamily)
MLFAIGLLHAAKQLGGDSTVYTHRIDEVNLVTSGSGKLIVGKDNIPAKRGDIIYVQRGTGHSFNSLAQDMDILIFFEMRSLQQ